jgi:hypothetical protein
MSTDLFREYSTRLTLAYVGYFETLRNAFFPSARPSARTRAEQPEQRWEDEGGKAK